MVKKISHPKAKSAKTITPKKAPTKKTAPVQETAPRSRPDPKLPKVDLEVVARLEEFLKSLPKEVVDPVRKELDPILNGKDMRWLELYKMGPEELLEIAKAGFVHFENGRNAAARRIFRGLSVVDPENFYNHSMVGAIAQREEKWAEAILEYSVALDLNPEDLTSYTNRGECYFRLGFFDKAKHDLSAATRRDPKKQNAWANRARLLQQQIQTIETRTR